MWKVSKRVRLEIWSSSNRVVCVQQSHCAFKKSCKAEVLRQISRKISFASHQNRKNSSKMSEEKKVSWSESEERGKWAWKVKSLQTLRRRRKNKSWLPRQKNFQLTFRPQKMRWGNFHELASDTQRPGNQMSRASSRGKIYFGGKSLFSKPSEVEFYRISWFRASHVSRKFRLESGHLDVGCSS